MEKAEQDKLNYDNAGGSVIGTKEVGKDGVEYVVKKLCQRIRESLTEEDWKRYEEQKTDRGRIQLFLGKKEIQSCVSKYLKLHPGHKDKAKAMMLKNAGNVAFSKGDNEQALYLYTQCLVWMPHDGTKDVSVVYANRSAALFHLEEFLLAKRDAELAFQLNYPVELHYKLYERMGRCCHHLNRGDEARKNFHAAIKALQSFQLDEQKRTRTKKALEELIKNPPNFAHGFHQNQDLVANHQNESQALLPDVVGGRNKYLKSASSRLSLQYRENRGRFVIANEPFYPGDVILVEKALVSVLYPEQYHRQCSQCYAPLHAPVVCEKCIFASFCSTNCKEKARQHHQYECRILGLLKNSGISVICFMALRILTQTDPKTVLSWYELAVRTEDEELKEIPEDDSNDCGDNKTTSSSREALGFNEEYPTNHIALFHLVTHNAQRKPEDSFHQIIMTLFLLQALRNTSYFDSFSGSGLSESKDKTKEAAPSGPKGNVEQEQGEEVSSKKNGNENMEPQTQDIPVEIVTKFAVLILRCLKAFQFNAHETSGWDDKKEGDNSVGLGGGLFPTLALFNHSCNPAIVRYFVNDTVVARAVKTILPGEPVTENYGPVYTNTPKDERQSRMVNYYRFSCDCIACREDWPLFENMTNDMMKFRCQKCRTFICKSDENMGILFKCGKCGDSVNILKALKALQDTDSKYKNAVDFINSGQEERGMGIMLETLKMLEAYLMPPFRELHMCQEHVRRCLLSSGNRISRLPQWDPEKLSD